MSLKIQGECKLCERLREFVFENVIATQKLNAHHCEDQHIFFARMRKK
jgi:hypothetical protein